ncbi:MAG TPA: glycosyltransferase family 39 protein [Methylomirabilota bacterium]|nr:glycosyltransferase family 39 protein [Methylomirabilota bacterium]
MTAKVLLGVGAVAAALYFLGLGGAPFLDPPEGIHAAISWEMLQHGQWITPHLDGVPYFDKPPLLYWLMAASFAVLGPTELAARIWSAVPAVAVALLTARLGMLLGSVRLGLLAGLMVAANLELFLFGRIVKPDLLFVALILLGFIGFARVYLGGGRGTLWLFYGALGLAVLAKDLLGAIGPLLAVALFFYLTRESRAWARWFPWSGVALLLVIAVPWYALAEFRNRGFLWYTIVDNHLLALARQRVFPDEDVPLGALEFLGVTAAGFFPWVLALPWAVWRVLRRPWLSAEARLWMLVGLWTVGVLGFFTFSPFKLPHYGLPAFPAMALLVAKLWDETLEGGLEAPSPQTLLWPPLGVFAVTALASFLVWRGVLGLPAGAVSVADVSARNMAAQGQQASLDFLSQLRPLFGSLALIFGLGTVGIAVGLWRRRPLLGIGALLAVMVAFLPVSVEGLAIFAKARSVRLMTDALMLRIAPGDLVAHEGPIENSASALIVLDRPVKIVNGLQSNLAFGSTFREARGTFWDGKALALAWQGPQRIFLISVVRPAKSVVQELPQGQAHLLREGGGRWLYSNRP